jgi:hypothetical protein
MKETYALATNFSSLENGKNTGIGSRTRSNGQNFLHLFGFEGPSLCHMCSMVEERIEHILNGIPEDRLLWDHEVELFRHADRKQKNILRSLKY